VNYDGKRRRRGGKATYMRNWPYAYELGHAKGSKVRGKIDAAPGRRPGAHRLRDEPRPAAAHAARRLAGRRDLGRLRRPGRPREAPVRRPAARRGGPGEVAPGLPVYPQISQAIYENVSAALEGSVPPAQALEDAQADIEKALETF
jgi:multiple sugar transport system substrate-binding protein